MRIAVFDKAGAPTLGVVLGDELVDLSVAAPDLPSDLAGLIRGGASAFELAGSAAEAAAGRLPFAEQRLHVPLPRPGKIICLGLNYADHAAEGGHSRPEYPSFFMRAPTSMVAHGAPIIRPRVCEQLDYEAEMVAVVGAHARHVPREIALQCIVGYSCFNEGSVRAYQRKTSQWTIGKNFDSTGAFGPCFVTADELPPGGAGLDIQSRLNGQVMQHANTSDMLFDVAETVALLTECMTLEPGDIIVTGTPAGVGHARKPPVWMKPGDTIEVEIEGVGLLSNPIEDEPAA